MSEVLKCDICGQLSYTDPKNKVFREWAQPTELEAVGSKEKITVIMKLYIGTYNDQNICRRCVIQAITNIYNDMMKALKQEATKIF